MMEKNLTIKYLVTGILEVDITVKYADGASLNQCIKNLTNSDLAHLENTSGALVKTNKIHPIHTVETLSAGSLGPRPTVSIYYDDELLNHNGQKEDLNPVTYDEFYYRHGKKGPYGYKGGWYKMDEMIQLGLEKEAIKAMLNN